MKDTTEQSSYLADTYALIELIGGNQSYLKYLNSFIATTQFNIIELYYHLIQTYDKETANRYFALYSEFIVPISPSSIKFGMKFRLKYKKEKVSYVDCVGYALATELGIKFLTGDEKFRNKENVEFVK